MTIKRGPRLLQRTAGLGTQAASTPKCGCMHFLRKFVRSGDLEVYSVSMDLQHADLLTKELAATPFMKYRQPLLILPMQRGAGRFCRIDRWYGEQKLSARRRLYWSRLHNVVMYLLRSHHGANLRGIERVRSALGVVGVSALASTDDALWDQIFRRVRKS